MHVDVAHIIRHQNIVGKRYYYVVSYYSNIGFPSRSILDDAFHNACHT